MALHCLRVIVLPSHLLPFQCFSTFTYILFLSSRHCYSFAEACCHYYILLHIVKDIVVIFREIFSSCDPSIHPSIPSSIHGWHHTRNKTLAEINNPPLLHLCHCLGKACPAPRGSDINIRPKGPNTP